jgi:hypothetical protein
VVVIAAAAVIAAVAAAATSMSDSELELLMPQAAAIGVAWANECAVDLRSNEREVVGAWPGTIREARSRVLSVLPAARMRPTLDTEALQLLARAAYEAARRSWRAMSEPDPEP